MFSAEINTFESMHGAWVEGGTKIIVKAGMTSPIFYAGADFVFVTRNLSVRFQVVQL